MSSYRDPGSAQRTKAQINDRIRSYIAANTVTMAAATTVTASWSSTSAQPLDLASDVGRVLGESV